MHPRPCISKAHRNRKHDPNILLRSSSVRWPYAFRTPTAKRHRNTSKTLETHPQKQKLDENDDSLLIRRLAINPRPHFASLSSLLSLSPTSHIPSHVGAVRAVPSLVRCSIHFLRGDIYIYICMYTCTYHYYYIYLHWLFLEKERSSKASPQFHFYTAHIMLHPKTLTHPS